MGVHEWPADSPIVPDGLPYCATCQGMRVVHREAAPHELTGKLVACPACSALVTRRRRNALYRAKRALIDLYSQLQGRALSQTFDTFDLQKVSQSVREAYLAAATFAQAPQGFLVFSGSVGTGKSHLAAAIANYQNAQPEAIDRAILFFITPSLLELLRGGYARGDYDTLLTLTMDCELLILDDLGAESQTDWATEKLFVIVNHRYQMRLPTVVVTNCALVDLEPRMRSRLSENGFSCCMVLAGDDYRLRGTQ